jgi:two-component system, NtrC family, response regulator AtoC
VTAAKKNEPGALTATLPLSLRSSHFTAGLARRPSLVAVHGAWVEIVPLVEGEPVVIGRERPADVVCPSPFLSRRHASFTLRSGAVHVRDLGSTNGVFMGKRAVTEATLSEGDSARLGPVRISFQLLDEEERGGEIAGHDRFITLVADEVERSHIFKRSFAVLHVRAEGGRASEGAVGPFVRTLLRTIDRVGVYGPGTVEVVLPEASEPDAMATAHALAAAQREGIPRLVVGVATYPACSGAEELLAFSRAAAQRATKDEPVVVHHPAGDENEADPTELVAESPKMKALLALVDRVAKSHLPILVLGETGSGKEIIARRVHEKSGRGGRTVSVNCAAIAQQLLESTLFGHEKGAFTGAISQQRGVFEAADDGTVFLDEVGELSASAQAALLRALETRRIVRVGSTTEIPVDVRIVAATHRNLEQMVSAGTFREDLLFRLNTVTLDVAPLRERPADVEPLAKLFLTRMRRDGQTQARGFEPVVLDLLRSYAWPGNVRELRNAVERAAVVAGGAKIAPVDLPDRLSNPPRSRRAALEQSPPSSKGPRSVQERMDYAAQMRLAETEILLEALERAGGKQVDAAALLDMPLRTFKYRLSKLGIRRTGYVRAD